ncbi:hypothetical protein L596_027488 [Steinernema carpocapsae]|uniref:Uncharacterized protein n=1 Tax=Steinernema carpocapsae TaxID=34508 RepID=A0A4U5LVM9_STECR|nr:hypothetical protein L596_027488 [Steinernema carpocapsae]
MASSLQLCRGELEWKLESRAQSASFRLFCLLSSGVKGYPNSINLTLKRHKSCASCGSTPAIKTSESESEF